MRLVAVDVGLPDVHAAGEGVLPVDHQQLAVVAQVEQRHLPRRPAPQEHPRGHARAMQRVTVPLAPPRPDRVDQHPHLDPARVSGDQRVGEAGGPTRRRRGCR
ncbi:MAG: hypothetical protein R3F59_33095 [Myxococcota bacterium]